MPQNALLDKQTQEVQPATVGLNCSKNLKSTTVEVLFTNNNQNTERHLCQTGHFIRQTYNVLSTNLPWSDPESMRSI